MSAFLSPSFFSFRMRSSCFFCFSHNIFSTANSSCKLFIRFFSRAISFLLSLIPAVSSRSKEASSFSSTIISLAFFCSSNGLLLLLILTLAQAVSNTSMALSGSCLPVIYRAERLAAALSASSSI